MNTTQDILNILVAVGFLVITVCAVYITYYLVQALKSVTSLTDSLEETTHSLRDKIQFKALAAIPALLVALVGRIFKKRG